MLVRIAGMTAIKYRESVTGVVLMDGAVEKIGRQEMAAMEHLVDNLNIYVFSIPLWVSLWMFCQWVLGHSVYSKNLGTEIFGSQILKVPFQSPYLFCAAIFSPAISLK